MALVEAEDTTLERLREGDLISCDNGTLTRHVDLPPTPLADALASKEPISIPAYVSMSTKLDGRDKMTKASEPQPMQSLYCLLHE